MAQNRHLTNGRLTIPQHKNYIGYGVSDNGIWKVLTKAGILRQTCHLKMGVFIEHYTFSLISLTEPVSASLNFDGMVITSPKLFSFFLYCLRTHV